MRRNLDRLRYPEVNTMIGQLIGNTVRIEEKIGEGGMGAVYRGRDLMLERDVAIKALRPELARQPELVNRFRTEAVTLARLNHPHIATLYSFQRHGEDYLMVMEFIEGVELDKRIEQEGALPVVEAVRIFRQALEAIIYAHAAGVIHRDLKPANIMLNEQGHAVVMDFGIARLLGTARQTQTGRFFGTLAYMSPEQLQGREADARSDIYSLGILLYEMLTGRVPFDCASDYALIRAQVEETPIAPRDLKGDSIPVAVELALMRALAKEPEARFQTADEFRAALLAAVPEAALAPKPMARPAIKPTRQAFDASELPFDAPMPETRRPASTSSAEASHQQRLVALLAGWSWKQYAGIGAGLLALVVSFVALRGDGAKPEPPKPATVVVQPAPEPNLQVNDAIEITPLPSPTLAPASAPAAAPRRRVTPAYRPPASQTSRVEQPPAARTEQAAQSQPARGAQERRQSDNTFNLRIGIPKTGIGVDLKMPWGGGKEKKEKDEKKKKNE
jgi:serine/threonine-protein kinase